MEETLAGAHHKRDRGAARIAAAGESSAVEREKDKMPVHEVLAMEVMMQILGFLPVGTLLAAEMVCVEWRNIASTETVWRKVYNANFGGSPLKAAKGGNIDYRKLSITKAQNDQRRREEMENPRGHRLYILQEHLKWAISEGHHVIVDRLLREYLTSDPPPEPPEEILLRSIQRGYSYKDDPRPFVTVEMLNGDHLLWSRWNPAHIAVKSGSSKLVELLALKGVDMNKVASSGERPLVMASKLGHLEVVEVLLRFVPGDQLDEVMKIKMRGKQTSLLHVAASGGYLRLAKTLLELMRSHEQDHLNKKDSRGYNVFHCACDGGNPELVQFLLERCPHLLHEPTSGRSALSIAVSRGHVAVAKLLLERGLQIEDKGPHPFLTACSNGNMEMAKMLLEFGCSVNECRGGVPIQRACKGSAKADFVSQFLLKHGASVNSVDAKDKCPPLQYALQRPLKPDTLELVKLLLENGADVSNPAFLNLSAFDSFTPRLFAPIREPKTREIGFRILLALQCHGVDIREYLCKVKYLIYSGFSYDDVQLMLVLKLPISWEHVMPDRYLQDETIIGLLLRNGADVNQLDGQGRSPLFYVKNRQVSSLLLDAGARIDFVDVDQRNVVVYWCEETRLLMDEPGLLLTVWPKFSEWLATDGKQKERTMAALRHARVAVDILGDLSHW